MLPLKFNVLAKSSQICSKKAFKSFVAVSGSSSPCRVLIPKCSLNWSANESSVA
jgi:hypothetical protein